ncbi:ANTAR domain-containing protein [Streptomyces sp. MAR4 CNX-425]|uniref:ANTAR domain-containing protein n=1 Tax=Streptomyces sp. MAR4 CNX-425 TaxID=3406343 RepID=UPI003B510C34
MSEESREEGLAAAFVELADTLVSDFDVEQHVRSLARHCARLVDVTAAGVVLAADTGTAPTASASDEHTHALELAGLEWGEGPAADCRRTARELPPTALAHPRARAEWPRFTGRALELGFVLVAAAPMRARGTAVGALTLYHDRPGAPTAAQLRLGRALADVATIGILQQRALAERSAVAAQLQNALDSRVVIEQAKGALSQRRSIAVDEAFRLLRGHARNTRRPLTDVAREVVENGLDPAAKEG